MKSPRVAAGVALGVGALYYALLRRPILTWGATEAEATARLPGDELLEDPDGVSTRAIDIHAPPSAVWPWLAQMGPSPRAGADTDDWIENMLGLNMHSADRILPELQHPEVGETIGFGSNRDWNGSSPTSCSHGDPRTRAGVVVPARRARWHHPADQPQPVSPPELGRTDRHGSVTNGSGVIDSAGPAPASASIVATTHRASAGGS